MVHRMRKRFARLAIGLAAVLAASVGVVSVPAQQASAAPTQATTFQESLVQGPSGDPAIVPFQGDYYMVFAKWAHQGDGLWIRKSSSLSNMQYGTDTLVWSGTTGITRVINGGGWLVNYSSKWYLYGWGDNGNGTTPIPFVLESATNDPLSSYSLKATFSTPVPQGGYADSPLVINGTRYLSMTGMTGGIYLASMSDPWTLSSSWSKISTPTAAWECQPLNGSPTCVNEGASVVSHGGKTFLAFSASHFVLPDYCVGLLTMTNGSDPLLAASWTKSNGCVFQRNDPQGAYGPGSLGFFSSPDGTEDWFAYHVKTTNTVDGGPRQIQAQKLTWDPSGNPVFGSPVSVASYAALPSGDAGSDVYEAENATVSGSSTAASSTASNAQYVQPLSAAGSSITFSVTSPTAGVHPFHVRYGNAGASTATMPLSVNGTSTGTASFPPTGSSSSFPLSSETTLQLRLTAGTNTITLTHGSGGVSFDKAVLGQTVTGDGLAAASMSTNTLQLFSRTSGDQIDENTWTSAAGWSGWTATLPSLAVGAAGFPAASSRLTNFLDVFVVGKDGNLWTTFWNGSVWASWYSLGAPPDGLNGAGVAVANPTSTSIDVFALGAADALWMITWDQATGWSGWTQNVPNPSTGLTDRPGGQPGINGLGISVSAPAAVSRKADQIDLFVTGSDGNVWTVWWDGQWWDWYILAAPPGGATSAPSVAARGPNNMDIYVRGGDGQIWSRAWTASGGWGGWFLPNLSPAAGLKSAPASTSKAGFGSLEVFARANDGNDWANWWDSSSGWHSWYSFAPTP